MHIYSDQIYVFYVFETCDSQAFTLKSYHNFSIEPRFTIRQKNIVICISFQNQRTPFWHCLIEAMQRLIVLCLVLISFVGPEYN